MYQTIPVKIKKKTSETKKNKMKQLKKKKKKSKLKKKMIGSMRPIIASHGFSFFLLTSVIISGLRDSRKEN